ncbi:MAG: DUF6562 domain-containing protein [Alistipes sp.]|nr:DUF6562 domain-containing protein [Alistipes sp.]
MKKLLACFLAIIAFVGCSKESALDVVVGGDETYHVTVGIDEQTRAEISTIAALLGNAYELRYVLEIYENNARLGGQQIQYSADSSVVFAVKLPPLRNYRFVAWADVVAKRTDESQTPANIYYNTSNLSAVSVKLWANSDLRDAFADYEVVTKFSSSSVVNLKLMRPFAKLRIVDNNGVTRSDVKTITVSYSPVGGSSSYYKYNAMRDEFIGAVATPITRTYNVSAIGATGADGVTLFTDLIFVPESTQFNVEVSLYDAGDVLLETKNFGSVAVNRNTLTTIKGDII